MIDLKDFIEAIKESKPKTSAYDTIATVRRVEGNTAWVHIPGGLDETPVKMTVNAQAGDTVQVRVSGGSAFIVGNATAPPTDDTKAIKVEQKVGIVERVVTAVKEVAESTAKIAGNTRQYFWFTSDPAIGDTGAHITEVPQDEFLADPANGGGNLLARSNGIAIRDGTTELATFSSSTIQLGQNSSTATIELCDAEGRIRFNSSDNTLVLESGVEAASSGRVRIQPYGTYASSLPAFSIDGSTSSTQVTGEIAYFGGHVAASGGNAETFIDTNGKITVGRLKIEQQTVNNVTQDVLVPDLTKDVLVANGKSYFNAAAYDKNSNEIVGQKNPTSWTAPTVVSNQATIRQGGYYSEGKRTYVQMEIRLASSLAEDTTLSEFLQGFPAPVNTLAVLSIATGGGGWGWAAVNTSGKMNIRLNKQTGTSTNIYITGCYTTA